MAPQKVGAWSSAEKLFVLKGLPPYAKGNQWLPSGETGPNVQGGAGKWKDIPATPNTFCSGYHVRKGGIYNGKPFFGAFNM